jgi:hypothetical protein
MANEDDKIGFNETPNPEGEKKEVESWLKTIAATEKWRDSVGEKAGWKRFIKEFKGDWAFLQGTTSIPIVPVNLVNAYVKTAVAHLYFRDPWITVNAKRMEDLGAAQIAENILNYTWSNIKLKAQWKLALQEALIVGHSYMKTGYVAEFGTVESQPKEERGPGRPKKKLKELDTNQYIKSENVFAYHVPYKDIIFDPSATYPWTHNARWMAHKITRPLRAIKQSGIYEHTDELKVSSHSDDPNTQFSVAEATQEAMGKGVKNATLWEIYDLDNQVITTVSPGNPYKLRNIPLPDYLDGGFPVVELAFNPIPGEVFALSDVATQEGVIMELTKILSIEMNHLKRWNRQIIVEPELFTEVEESKFRDGIDGAIIKAQGPIQDKFFIPPYAPVQSDCYQIWNQVMDVYRVVSGQTQADQGGQAKTQTRTLGELRMQLQGSHARSEEKVDVLEDAIEELALKMLTIMQKKYDLPKIARIVGPKAVQEKLLGILPQRPSAQPQMPGGQPNPVAPKTMTGDGMFSWNRQDIMGEMDVDVVAGSTVPMDRESQLQIMERMIPMAPALGITPGSPAAKEWAREFLRLTGITSMQSVMDLADQTPPQMPPKLMEIQAKVQAMQAQSQMKVQGLAAKAQADKVKAQLEIEKAQIQLRQQEEKHKLETNKTITDMVLQQFRTPVATNGNGPETP